MAKQPINVTSATLTLDRDTHEGTVVTVNKADGCTVTLPASTGKGDEYTIYCGTTITSVGLIIQVANASDTMAGGVSISTDIAGVTMLAGGTNDTITMSGSTTGGVAGSWVKLTDVAANKWMVNGFLASTGTEATPFSAAVS
jgi:hypothetical protein